MLPISRLTEDIGELVAGLAHHKVYKVERSRFSDGTRPLILIDHLEYKVGTLSRSNPFLSHVRCKI